MRPAGLYLRKSEVRMLVALTRYAFPRGGKPVGLVIVIIAALAFCIWMMPPWFSIAFSVFCAGWFALFLWAPVHGLPVAPQSGEDYLKPIDKFPELRDVANSICDRLDRPRLAWMRFRPQAHLWYDAKPGVLTIPLLGLTAAQPPDWSAHITRTVTMSAMSRWLLMRVECALDTLQYCRNTASYIELTAAIERWQAACDRCFRPEVENETIAKAIAAALVPMCRDIAERHKGILYEQDPEMMPLYLAALRDLMPFFEGKTMRDVPDVLAGAFAKDPRLFPAMVYAITGFLSMELLKEGMRTALWARMTPGELRIVHPHTLVRQLFHREISGDDFRYAFL